MQKVDSQTPPSLLSFTIVCPQWLEDTHAEDTQSLLKQILCFINFKEKLNRQEPFHANGSEAITTSATEVINSNTQWLTPWLNNTKKSIDGNKKEEGENVFETSTSINEIVKEVGLLNAISDISGKFNNKSKNTKLSYIDTDRTRIVVGSFEIIGSNSESLSFWFSCQFQFAKVTMTNGDIRYIQRGLASPEYLKAEILRGYELWCLNNGSLINFIKRVDKPQAQREITKWWYNWFVNKFEFPSSFDTSFDALFKLIPGVRYSCVEKPVGFQENINERLAAFISQEEGLNDLIIINTNWTPEKNWGIIYMNSDENTTYSKWSLTSLLTFFKDIDLNFGLSTYALTYGNWPSLKQYVNTLKRMKSISPSGGLLERSLMEPALYLHEKLTNTVFNPFGSMVDTMESYIPSFSKLLDVSSIVPTTVSSINTVKNVTLYPWNSLSSYWSGHGEIASNNQPEVQPQEVESRSASKKSVQSNIEESLEIAQKSGSYLLGCSAEGSIILHDFNIYNTKSGNWDVVKLVVYELNGILFMLFYDSTFNSLLSESVNFYQQLSAKLDSIYETYFTDLIFNQLKSLEEDMKMTAECNKSKREDFAFIIYDDEKYWTNISNIPPDHDTLMHQIPERIHIVESNLSANDLEFIRTLALMQDRQLHTVIENNITPSSDWIAEEKIIKLGRNRWCFFYRYNNKKWVMVIKSLFNVDVNSGGNPFMFGDEVQRWLDWVGSDGYL